MRLTVTVVDPDDRARADVVLDADPTVRVGAVAKELARHVGHATRGPESATVPERAGEEIPESRDEPPLYVDGYPVDPEYDISASPLRDGAVVSLLSSAGCPAGEPTGVVELRVVSGPGAGLVHRLSPGNVDIGSGTAVRVRIDDPELAERALTLSISVSGACRITMHGDMDGKLDGESLEGDSWPHGARLAVGNTLLEVVPYTAPNAALQASDDGAALNYNRPPRLAAPDRTTHFRLPAPPKDPDPRPLPWLMAIAPLITAVVMALVMDRWVYLIMAVMSPIMMVGNYVMDRKQGRKSHARMLREYREHKARIDKDAQDALVAERHDRHAVAPDPASLLGTATGPRTRLWERRRTDADHLLVRLGTGTLPSAVVLDDPEQDEHRRSVTWQLDDVPVTLPLKDLGVVGFAGPGDLARTLGRWTVSQIAVLHSPMDVQFYVLTDGSGQDSWDWVRWLPHAGPGTGQDANCLVGTDAETVAARIAELTALLEARLKAADGQQGQEGPMFKDPDIVVVLDGARRLRSLPGVVRLLREGPQVAIHAICLDSEERFLPGECQAVTVASVTTDATNVDTTSTGALSGTRTALPFLDAWRTGPTALPQAPPTRQDHTAAPVRLRVERASAARTRDVRPDLVTPDWCLKVARCLSPIRDISSEAEDSAIPSTSRLLDVLDLEPPTGDALTARWRREGATTAAVVGESYDGPFAIDLRRDGPHGLIAGTTGSGKSELLQTIVASLAAANTPEAMTFVLVDYKGGSAFKDCVQLPHTVGMVTDLDAHLVERALESLGAELKRREHMLADAATKDIEDYQDLLRREPGRRDPMPRLLIVIDEFASLARELPDFVAGLVNIAQRGRSLGIHLLLATQRPSGVISPEIQANTNLRIALRVTDTGESTDVIEAPDAGLISKNTPGRAYVRLGHASLVPFQSGRVGGRRPGADDEDATAPWSHPLTWDDLGRTQIRRPPGSGTEEEEHTDLSVLVTAVTDAATQMDIPTQHSPWLPALPETILLDDLPAPAQAGALPPAPFGIADLPFEQARHTVAVDFANFEHLLIGSAPRSGRSQLLRTIAGSLARIHSVADVHLYGIDCGNGALNALTRLPHCGAVVSRSQSERAVRLVSRLKQEMTARQEMLAASSYADISEQRAAASPEDRLPYIVVLLDRWEGWLPTLGELEHGELTDELYAVMREGASVGVHLIVTGDRSVLMGKISTLTEEKYAMRLADRSDISMIGISPKKVPDTVPQGRMFRGESGLETQVALLTEDPSGQAQAAALDEIGQAATERHGELRRAQRPFRVDVLPSRISFEEAMRMRDAETSGPPMWGLVGVGGDELTAYGPDLGSGTPGFVIAGPQQSGRSTVLMSMARAYLAQGVRLVLAVPRESPLQQLEDADGVLRLFTDDDIEQEDMAEALASSSPDEPVVVLMDDAEIFESCTAEEEFRKILTQGTSLGRGIVLAGDEEDVCEGFSGWQVDVKKARRGILLSPQESMSGGLVGVRLSRSSVGEQIQPGQGLLHLGDGELLTVTVPHAQ